MTRLYRLNETHQEVLKAKVRTIENHPVRGVSFKDVSHILWNQDDRYMANRYMLRAAESMVHPGPVRVLPIETRGHWFATALADGLDAELAFVRKADKSVPGTYGAIVESTSEYGSTKFAVPHFEPCERLNVVLVDDIIATGGTALAIANDLQKRYATHMLNVCIVALAEIVDLCGRDRLLAAGHKAESVVQY